MNWYKNIKIADPIGNFEEIEIEGQDPERFKNYDRKILNSPKAIENIKRKWEEVGPWINVYFIPMEQINLKLFTNVDDFIPEIEQLKDPHKITLIITNSQDHPTTPWMIAHRLSHAIPVPEYIPYFRMIMRNLYSCYKVKTDDPNMLLYTSDRQQLNGKLEVKMLSSMLTMKSARDNAIQNVEEALHELFAQYLMTGKITINNPAKILSASVHVFSAEDDRAYEIPAKAVLNKDPFVFIKQAKDTLSEYFEIGLNNAKGKILFD